MRLITLFIIVSSIVLQAQPVDKNYLLGKFDLATHPQFVKLADEHTRGSGRGAYLRKETYEAFVKMRDAARKEGVELTIISITLLLIGKCLIILGLFFCAFSFLYYLGPDQKLKWKFISAGSTFATLLSIVASLCFSFYVNHFGNYNQLYGSIGTLIVIMLWIYFNAIIILLGFELNASIHSAKLKRSI